MAQATPETAISQDAAPGMAESLSIMIGRKLTVEDVREEGLKALEFLREEGKCPVCQIGEVKYIPAVSCGVDHRCTYDPCRAFYTRPEVGFPGETRDPILDEGIAFETGYKVLSERHHLRQRKG